MIYGLVLMVASNMVAWHEVLAQSSTSLSELRSVVWRISLFYTLWALYNKYGTGRQELGQYSFGLLFLSCLEIPQLSIITKSFLLLSSGLVTVNFAAVLPMIASFGGPEAFAKKIRKTDSKLVVVWGYTFSAYIASNTLLWSYCCYLFYKMPLEDINES